jgi:hypothetical protein
MAQGGKPIWGSGGGEAVLGAGVGYVDPLMGNAHVVAHEGAHALMPSPLALFSRSNQPKIDPLSCFSWHKQDVTYVLHAELSKPTMNEDSYCARDCYMAYSIKLEYPPGQEMEVSFELSERII